MAVKCIIEVPNSSALAVAVQTFIVGLICLSTLSVIVETCPGAENHRWPFSLVENVVTVLFTVEILVRIWVSDSLHAYITACSNIVDIFATLPGYVEIFLASERIDPFWRLRNQRMDPVWTVTMLRVLQIVRLMRILRLAKAARHSEIVATVMMSFYASLTGLSALIVFVGSSAVLSATVVFYTESVDMETQFTSIPAALWWSLATITGVGYGDMVPMTLAGKTVGAATMVVGVLAISMSVAIITTAFMEEYRKSLALLKLDRVRKRRSLKTILRDADHDRERKNSIGELKGELSPIAPLPDRPGRSTFTIDVDDGNLLATLITLEQSTKDILMHLEATALEVEKTEPTDPSPPTRVSFSSPSLYGSSGHMAGTKTALAFLREQNAVWFKHATQLAEQILESGVEAEGPGEEPPP